jgi:hypothetical protein
MTRLLGLKAPTVVLMILCAGWLHAQTSASSQPRSRYQGRTVNDPEGLSGLWESSNGSGGFVGIHMILGTSVAPDAKSDGRTLKGVQQRWEGLSLGVYTQTGPESGEDRGYFSDREGDASSVRFEGGHLELHYDSRRVRGAPGIVDLDLRKDGDRWVGRFHWGDFDQQVILERPGAGLKAHNRITGTWRSEMFTGRVVHVVERAAGIFAGWSDELQIPGTVRFAPWVEPYRLFQSYGNQMNVERVGKAGVMFGFGASSGMCCRNTIAGKLSSDGSWIDSRLGAAVPMTWVRVR